MIGIIDFTESNEKKINPLKSKVNERWFDFYTNDEWKEEQQHTKKRLFGMASDFFATNSSEWYMNCFMHASFNSS